MFEIKISDYVSVFCDDNAENKSIEYTDGLGVKTIIKKDNINKPDLKSTIKYVLKSKKVDVLDIDAKFNFLTISLIDWLKNDNYVLVEYNRYKFKNNNEVKHLNLSSSQTEANESRSVSKTKVTMLTQGEIIKQLKLEQPYFSDLVDYLVSNHVVLERDSLSVNKFLMSGSNSNYPVGVLFNKKENFNFLKKMANFMDLSFILSNNPLYLLNFDNLESNNDYSLQQQNQLQLRLSKLHVFLRLIAKSSFKNEIMQLDGKEEILLILYNVLNLSNAKSIDFDILTGLFNIFYYDLKDDINYLTSEEKIQKIRFYQTYLYFAIDYFNKNHKLLLAMSELGLNNFFTDIKNKKNLYKITTQMLSLQQAVSARNNAFSDNYIFTPFNDIQIIDLDEPLVINNNAYPKHDGTYTKIVVYPLLNKSDFQLESAFMSNCVQDKIQVNSFDYFKDNNEVRVHYHVVLMANDSLVQPCDKKHHNKGVHFSLSYKIKSDVNHDLCFTTKTIKLVDGTTVANNDLYKKSNIDFSSDDIGLIQFLGYKNDYAYLNMHRNHLSPAELILRKTYFDNEMKNIIAKAMNKF